MRTGKRTVRGFTYIGLLLAVALFGMASVGAARLLASAERGEREAELLFVGNQFRQAIRSYLQAGPRQYPASLDDLLLDRRQPTVRRHLRRMFVDPVTGKPEWGLVAAPEGGIMGVHSLSEREPLKRANFEPDDALFALTLQSPQPAPGAVSGGASPFVAASSASLTPLAAGQPYSYRDWKFVYRPAAAAATFRSPRLTRG